MGCSSSGINRETNRGIISVAVVPSKQKLFVQPKLKNNNVRLIRYITAVQDYAMHYMNAWLKRCVFNLDLNRESVSEPPKVIRKSIPEFGSQI